MTVTNDPTTDTRVFTVKRMIDDSDGFFNVQRHIAAGGLAGQSPSTTMRIMDAFALIVVWLGAVPIQPGSGIGAVPPYLTAATVNGTALVLTFSEALVGGTPAPSAFTVAGAASGVATISSVVKSGLTVTLTLAAPVYGTEAVTVAYTVPGSNALQGATSLLTSAFIIGVVNNTSGTIPPTDILPPVIFAAHVDTVTLVLTFNETLGAALSAVGAFAVTGAVTGSRTVASRVKSGATVTLTLGQAVSPMEAVTVTYTQPGSNPLADAAGNLVATFTAPVTNDTAGSILTTRPALVSTTNIAALNAQSPADGEVGLLRVGAGTYPDQHFLELTYYAAQGKWISDPIPVITQTDQNYMAPVAPGLTTDKYISAATTGGGPNQTGWATRYLHHSGELIAAGCSLQAAVSALIQGDGTNRMIVTPYWYSDVAGTAVSHVTGALAPQTAPAAVGSGPSIQSGLDNVIQYARSGWTAVTLAGGASGAGQRLWCGLFAKMAPAAGAAWGNVIDTDVSVRWVG
jgi:uncharacterized repeat protein (TIGR02059 family)